MSEKLIIKNQAKFQVYLSLFSSAVVGCSARKQDPQINIHEQARKIAKQADAIAVETFNQFETHLPTEPRPVEESGLKKGDVIEMP